MSEKLVVVVAGGEAPPPDAAGSLPRGVAVVAADRGVDHARALGLEITLAIGDFDSASADAVAAAEADGARVERHPQAKDATDLELALDAALGLGPARILVLAGLGDRLDHLVSALLLLGAPRYADVEIDARIGSSLIHVIRDERTLEGRPGDLVSLLPLHGPAEGVRTDGLAYALAGEKLDPGSSRGVSNVFAAKTARISVDRGILLAVRPGADDGGAK